MHLGSGLPKLRVTTRCIIPRLIRELGTANPPDAIRIGTVGEGIPGHAAACALCTRSSVPLAGQVRPPYPRGLRGYRDGVIGSPRSCPPSDHRGSAADVGTSPESSGPTPRHHRRAMDRTSSRICRELDLLELWARAVSDDAALVQSASLAAIRRRRLGPYAFQQIKTLHVLEHLSVFQIGVGPTRCRDFPEAL